MQANLRLDESGIPAAPPAPPVPTATRPVAATRAEEQGPKAKAEYDYQVRSVLAYPSRRVDQWRLRTDGSVFVLFIGG